MLYVTGITEREEGLRYYIFDNYTDSTIIDDNGIILKELLQRKYEVINAKLVNGDIEVKEWTYKLYQDIDRNRKINQFVVVGKTINNMYKTVLAYGYFQYINEEELNKYVDNDSIANFIQTDTGYELIDTIDTTVDTEFSAFIENEYKRHIAKVSLLGIDMSFEYRIDGDRVTLTEYTGQSKHPILPNFITDIGKYAFKSTKIESIKFNKGLRAIGECAIVGCKLTEVTIPETVEIIYQDAFRSNKIMHINSKLDTTKIKLLNENTLVIKGII